MDVDSPLKILKKQPLVFTYMVAVLFLDTHMYSFL